LQQTGITLPCAPERKGPWKRQRKKERKGRRIRRSERMKRIQIRAQTFQKPQQISSIAV
jgi:hypothetical protein